MAGAGVDLVAAVVMARPRMKRQAPKKKARMAILGGRMVGGCGPRTGEAVGCCECWRRDCSSRDGMRWGDGCRFSLRSAWLS